MKAKDLAEKLLMFPDYDVHFAFSDDNGQGFGGSPQSRTFDDIEVIKLEYLDGEIILSGSER